MGAYHFTLDFRNSMVPSVKSLSQKSKIFASSLSQGSLWVRYRYRAGQGSNESQKVAVRIVSGGTPQYLPPGGRCLGAQPQDGGSHRAHSQFQG